MSNRYHMDQPDSLGERNVARFGKIASAIGMIGAAGASVVEYMLHDLTPDRAAFNLSAIIVSGLVHLSLLAAATKQPELQYQEAYGSTEQY